MSEQNEKKPEVRSEEPELKDETLEQVAGGCQWGDSTVSDPIMTITKSPSPFPIIDQVDY